MPSRRIPRLLAAAGRNVFAHLSFVKFNRAFTWTESINVPWSDKELKIEYSTFRDKLSPGQEEAFRDARTGAAIVGWSWQESLRRSTATLAVLAT